MSVREGEPVRLYVGEDWRLPDMSHIPLLYPFWGVVQKENQPYVTNAYLSHPYGGEDFELVGKIEECDYAVVPHQYTRLSMRRPELLSRIRAQARAAGKLLLADISNDIETPVPGRDVVVLRTGPYRYALGQNEIVVPLPAEDLLQSYAGGKLPLCPAGGRPAVSFMGWSQAPLWQELKFRFKDMPTTLRALRHPERGAEHKGLLLRARAIRALTGNTRVDAHIVARTEYSGHRDTLRGSAEENRRAFVENLLAAAYALCVRGDGNMSYRFYEALSLGRIPLFVDTACVLPLETEINYKTFCVWADWRNLDRLGDILADFHAALSPEHFEQMQRRSREAYEKYLRPDVFPKHLAQQLRTRAAQFYNHSHA